MWGRYFVLAAVMGVGAWAQENGPEYFEKNVRPILVRSCISCHAATSKPIMGGLRLDSKEALAAGGSRGAAVVPGQPGESLLLKAVMHTAGALKMPPGPKLKDAEIAVLAQWIGMGAPWGAGVAIEKPVEKFWALAPPKKPAAVAVKDGAWPRGEIDRLLLAALEKKGLRPVGAADRRTLIRRATYDLTGLPPTPEEIQEFLKDRSPEAYAKLIDRLLASPRYGERWGRHWLDVARYADSNGLDENLVYKNAFRYRDYVIAAFNKDKPFNLFLTEQLAGDLLPESQNLEEQYERWTATGFLSLGAKMLAEDDPVKMQMDIVDEQLDTSMRAFLGLTVGCARCHDHKFDPIPTKDYYAMAGIFKSAKTMENFKVVAKWHEYVLAPKEDRERLEQALARIQAKSKEIESLTNAENKKLKAAAVEKVGDYLLASAAWREAKQVQVAPVEETKGGLVVEAGSVARGNVERKLEKKKTNVPKGVVGPYYAEYLVQAPKAGFYQLDIEEQEVGQGTPDLYVNEEWVRRGDAAVQNREASPEAGGWRFLAVVELREGENRLKLEHARRFPYFQKMLLSSYAAAALPKTSVQVARAYGVNPSTLENLEEYFDRSQGAAASVLGDWERNTDPKARVGLAKRYAEEFQRAGQDPALQKTKAFLEEKFGPFAAPADARRYYPASVIEALKKLEAERKALEEQKPVFPQAMGVREGETIGDIPIHKRGSHWTLGELAPRGVLSAVDSVPVPVIPAGQSGRLQLAQWMTDPRHPLTSRVIVNRVWRWHFGRGLVSTVDNFGRLGATPSHPELLDYLALRFMEQGWSMKALHRDIMLSAAYQMSSAHDAKAVEIDPENIYWWRMPRKRLEVEAIRDGILSSAGSLEHTGKGSLLKYKDREYVANTSRGGDIDYERPIRSIYLPVVRSSLYDVFGAFDLPDPTTSNGDRESSVVAPQALFMLNSSVVLTHSRRMAEQLRKMPEKERVQLAYERALGRGPSAQELDQALSFVAKMREEWKSDGEAEVRAWQSFLKALFSSSEMIYLN